MNSSLNPDLLLSLYFITSITFLSIFYKNYKKSKKRHRNEKKNILALNDQLQRQKKTLFKIAFLGKSNCKNVENLISETAEITSLDGIAIINQDEEIIFANEAYYKLHGVSAAGELLGQNIRVFYPNIEKKRLKKELLPQLRNRKRLTVESIGKKASGRTFPQELTLSLLDKDRYVVTIRDITSRKRVEKKVHELALFTTLSPSPIAKLSSSGLVILANPAAVKTFKLGRKQIIQEIIPELTRKKITSCIKTNDTIHFTVQFKDKHFSVILRGLSELNVAHLYANDITKLKETTKRLHENEHFLRTVVNTAPSAIFVKDRAGRYTLANESTAKVFGKSIEEVIGKTDHELLTSKTQADSFALHDKHVFETSKELQIRRETLTNPDGKSHIFQTIKKPLFLLNSVQPSHILGVGTDITSREKLQNKLNILRSHKRALGYQTEGLLKLSVSNNNPCDEIITENDDI